MEQYSIGNPVVYLVGSQSLSEFDSLLTKEYVGVVSQSKETINSRRKECLLQLSLRPCQLRTK
jgi:hypothetical protein